MSSGLDGTKIIDLSQGVAGPFATRLLSQLGARVIKIERPGVGDVIRTWDEYVNGMCSGHAWVNPGKESVALNLVTEEGQRLLLELVKTADVLIENFVPGTLERWRLGPDELRNANPELIVCRISGFGQDGPLRDRSALDLIIQGETGVITTNGTEEQPAKISLSIGDLSAAMYAIASILTALLKRERTGESNVIDVALFDCLMTFTGYFPYMWWYAGKRPGRVGVNHHTMTPYGPYIAGDGKVVILAGGAGSGETWRRFCDAIDRPELGRDPRFQTNGLRLESRAELNEIVAEALLAKSRDEWLARFHEHGITAGALNEFDEALEHERITWRGLITEVPSAVGPIKVFDFPAQFSSIESVNALGPPVVGEHTATVLAELGVDEARLSELKSRGVVD